MAHFSFIFRHADLHQALAAGFFEISRKELSFIGNFPFWISQICLHLIINSKQLWATAHLIWETNNFFYFFWVFYHSKSKVFLLEKSSSVWAVFKNRNELNTSGSLGLCVCISSILSISTGVGKKSKLRSKSKSKCTWELENFSMLEGNSRINSHLGISW